MTTRKQAMMHAHNSILLLAVVTSNGCLALKVDDKPPTAVAQIIVAGAPVKSGAVIPFMDMPVTVQLDGTQSTDADGTIVSYKWLETDVPASARFPDGGAAFTGDPGNNSQVQVTLSAGKKRYSLWVMDDKGLISAPSTVVVQIGPPPPVPDMACAAAYMNPKKTCNDCACAPKAMMGCLDEFKACEMNADKDFAAKCTAVVKCALAKNCSGAACYVAGVCMTEIDMASGGDATTCMGDPTMNACAAATTFGTCTTTTCAKACM
jgi:hypothetical protein